LFPAAAGTPVVAGPASFIRIFNPEKLNPLNLIMNDHSSPEGLAQSRRQFLKQSSLMTAGALATLSAPAVLGQAKPQIRAVIIGLGGRGGGAGKNFLTAVKATGVDGRIVAVADLFPEKAARGRKNFDVPDERCFSGFDAYRKALAVPGVNYAIVATPPGFRPGLVRGCLEAGKNVFMEKPVATDGPGARVMFENGKLADRKGLKVAAGTQRRHQKSYIETIKRIQDGAIGDVVALRAYWVNGGPIWHRGDHGDTVLERQIRNWYHYIWLCGDHICEQHVHNLDVCNWIKGAHPVKAWGQGARQMLGNKSGEIWDEFSCEYAYEDGTPLFSYCGQIKRKWSSVSEFVDGAKGRANPHNTIFPKDGRRWRFRGKEINPYDQEHIDLINAIVHDTPLNETENVTSSTLTAIMGREAAYSGSGVTWDQILNSTFHYGPKQAYTDPSKLTFGEFRTLQPPLPSMHNIFSVPPEVPTVG
jgi:predicted dehydrogenase